MDRSCPCPPPQRGPRPDASAPARGAAVSRLPGPGPSVRTPLPCAHFVCGACAARPAKLRRTAADPHAASPTSCPQCPNAAVAAPCKRVAAKPKPRVRKAPEPPCPSEQGPTPTPLAFLPNPAIAGLHYSHANRRCRRTGDAAEYVALLATATHSASAGHLRFTVHAIDASRNILVGVATERAKEPRVKHPNQYGVFLSLFYGTVCVGRSVKRYAKVPLTGFPSGCRITVAVDFAKGTAAFEVDSHNFGPVKCRLPPSPLRPAVILYHDGSEVEFV